MRDYIDAAAFKEMILRADAALQANIQAINDLYVFPVPDGDTGTNMGLTINNAATSCFGVKGMVGRAKDSGPFQLLRRESMSKGVEVHFNDDESVSLELHIGVDQGVNISAVSRSIMKEVSYKLTKATGVPVKSVDVYVDTIIG